MTTSTMLHTADKVRSSNSDSKHSTLSLQSFRLLLPSNHSSCRRCHSYYQLIVIFFVLQSTMIQAMFQMPQPFLHFERQCDVKKNNCRAHFMSSIDDFNRKSFLSPGKQIITLDEVWYDLSNINGEKGLPLKVKVKPNVDIDAIKKLVKKENAIIFRNISTRKINMYKSVESTEALDVSTRWDSAGVI
jgi:hypothetical protein